MGSRRLKERREWIPSWQMLWLLVPNFLLASAVSNAPTLWGRPLQPLASVWVVLSSTSALVLMWWGTRTVWRTPSAPASGWKQRWLQLVRLGILVPCVLIGLFQFTRNIRQIAATPQYFNGSLAYLHLGAEEILQGQNPFADSQLLWKASRRWPMLLPTPLLRGRYANTPLRYPSPTELQTVMGLQAHNRLSRTGEFDPATAHNYPAGGYWLAIPMVWAGGISLQWLNVLAILVMMGLVLHRTPKSLRLLMGGLLVCQTMVFYTSFDALCMVFVLAAWHTQARGHLSAGLLGMACAIKQTAWLFIPFYLIEIAHREGWRVARRRGIECGAWFLGVNLPFLIADPSAWINSLIVPMHAALFPGGIGIIAPALGGVWPLWPSVVYGLLEGVVWFALILWYVRQRTVNSIGIVLALIPLLVAWRSFGTYFTLIPLLALWCFAKQASQSATNDAAVQPAINAVAQHTI